MACRDAPSFEEYVREWLYKTHTEAASEVYDFARSGNSLTNAVTLAIEVLPARKTARLRRLVELFEPYCEWKEEWEAKGWSIHAYGKGTVVAVAPKRSSFYEAVEKGIPREPRDSPDEDVIASVMGVDGTEFSEFVSGGGGDPEVGAVYYLGRSL